MEIAEPRTDTIENADDLCPILECEKCNSVFPIFKLKKLLPGPLPKNIFYRCTGCRHRNYLKASKYREYFETGKIVPDQESIAEGGSADDKDIEVLECDQVESTDINCPNCNAVVKYVEAHSSLKLPVQEITYPKVEINNQKVDIELKVSVDSNEMKKLLPLIQGGQFQIVFRKLFVGVE